MGNPDQLPSNRSFGATFAVVFALVGGYAWWRGTLPAGWAFALSGLTLLVTIARPTWLFPLNRAWMKLAQVLHRIVNPIVLAVIYFGVFAPVGIGMRWARRDALKRRFDPEARSYWIQREPPGPDPSGLPNQF